MNKNTLLLIFLVIGLSILSSCRKDRNDRTDEKPKMEELSVPAEFDWKTTQDLTIQFTSASAGLVEVLNEDNVRYQQVFISTDAPYIMKLTIPAYAKNIKVRHNGKEAILDITSENLSYNFN